MRATRDVDVLGIIDEANKVRSAKPLPSALLKASGQVAADLGLAENWLNAEPAGLVSLGLPDGFLDRLETRKYGRCLTVNFIGRRNQIFFKLYAAVDRGPGYHVDDLLALDPGEEELAAACRWAVTHDVSPGFKSILKDMLRDLGYESVCERI